MQQKRIAFGLFSNLQGLEIGARSANFKTRFSTDLEENARIIADGIWEPGTKETFISKNVIDLSFKRDIIPALERIGVEVKKGDVDLLLGGPPCFGMTLLNASYRSVFHELNFLMIETLRLVKEIQPKVVLIEQVPPLLSLQMRPFYNYFINEITALNNYDWDIQILNAQNFGGFQSRRRAMTMLVRKDVGIAPSFPEGKSVDLQKQSAFAAIRAELVRTSGFGKDGKANPRYIDGHENLFPTMTSEQADIFRDGRWQRLTIQDRIMLAHMDKYDLMNMSEASLSKMLGMMVLPPFSEALCRHIHTEILDKAAA